MNLRQIADNLGLPMPVKYPGDVLPGPFCFHFATELDYDEGSENTSDLLFTAAAATCGSDKRLQTLTGTGANPDVKMLVAGGIVELYDAAMLTDETVETVYGETKDMYLYRATAGDRTVDRLPLSPYVGIPSNCAVSGTAWSDGGSAAAQVYSYGLPVARRFTMHNPWIVDFESDTFAIAYSGNSSLSADTPVRAILYGVAFQAHGCIEPRGQDGECVIDAPRFLRDAEIKRRGLEKLFRM